MHLMCCEIWLPWPVMEEVSVWSGRSYHLAGEMLHICYSGYSLLVAVNFRVLCRSTGKWQIEFTGVKTALRWKEKTQFCVAVWRHTKVFLASAVACVSGGIWGAHGVSEHHSRHMQVLFVACLHAASSCPKTRCRSSKVIVAFMDPLWAIIRECFL